MPCAESVAEDAGVGASAKHSGAEPEIREAVAVGFGNALNQSVKPEASEVITHAALCQGFFRLPQQLGQMRAQLAVGKARRQQIEHQHGVPECLHVGIGNVQRRYALSLHHPRPLELL